MVTFLGRRHHRQLTVGCKLVPGAPIMGRCVAGPEPEMKICSLGFTWPPMKAKPPSGHSKMWSAWQPQRLAANTWPSSCTSTVSSSSGPVMSPASSTEGHGWPAAAVLAQASTGAKGSSTCSRMGMPDTRPQGMDTNSAMAPSPLELYRNDGRRSAGKRLKRCPAMLFHQGQPLHLAAAARCSKGTSRAEPATATRYPKTPLGPRHVPPHFGEFGWL